MRRLAWFLSTLSLVAACGSSGHGSTSGSTSSTRGGTTSTSSGNAQTRGLRGMPVRDFACPPRAVSSAAAPIPIDAAQALLLCPLSMPGRFSAAVTVPANQPLFEVLITALSAADIPPTPGAACPAYADLLQLVLAKTRGGAFQVSIPTDGCGHYQRGALDALNRARGG